jgi:hypothetical protein
MKPAIPIGRLLLCIWLVLFGLSSLVGLSFQGFNLVLGGLAIAAAVFLFLDR